MSELLKVSHNFCDPTTWYGESERIIDEIPTDVSGGILWSLAHQNIIDLTHGKIYREDDLAAEYAVVVVVSGATLTERAAFFDNGGDYTINYVSGTLTFESSQAGKDVKVSYSYANGSTWILEPASGVNFEVSYSEAQFSADVIMNDTIVVNVMGLADFFAPEYGFPSGSIIPLDTTRYKTITNIIDEAIGMLTPTPVIGGPKRGTQQIYYSFPFQYNNPRSLKSEYTMSVQISLENGLAFDGTYCTVSFFGIS